MMFVLRVNTAAVLSLVFIASQLPAAEEAWERLYQVADSAQDASAVVQELINAGVGEIRFPAGTYTFSRTVEIDLGKVGYCSIVGSSAARIRMAAAGPAFRFRGTHFKSADPSGFTEQVWNSERMPVVQDLAIEGGHAEADGIAAIGTMQLTVTGVHLRKLRHGIHLLENNRNVIVQGCHIYENTGIGVFYDDVNLHQSNIFGCHISYCQQGGIVSRKGNVRNIHITGCDLESNMSSQTEPTANVFIDCRGSQHGTAEVAITGCTIQHNDVGPQSANIRIIGQSVSPSALVDHQQEGHVTITGNVLSDVQTNVWLDDCRGVTLTGNTFWMGFEHNLLIENSSHIVIGPNNFDRNPRYNYGRSLTAKNQLVFRNCQDCTLSGLHIAHVWKSPAALSMIECGRMHVTGLTILDCDVGLHLRQVINSRFSNCLIRDDREHSQSKALVIENCSGNEFDSSLIPAR